MAELTADPAPLSPEQRVEQAARAFEQKQQRISTYPIAQSTTRKLKRTSWIALASKHHIVAPRDVRFRDIGKRDRGKRLLTPAARKERQAS
ncbi:Uu.00g031030.m01.CDS01 [Anthostomella pinea]|uniref:Uu.00g031030.m01.CDS01 n=1 Tax=Anthostomella pinea TaxID=933095 RepID=A0AAI8YD05_9PEZI|nr:Uu.00g031030.m01.CDS01 [Anthostomella pinea]